MYVNITDNVLAISYDFTLIRTLTSVLLQTTFIFKLNIKGDVLKNDHAGLVHQKDVKTVVHNT